MKLDPASGKYLLPVRNFGEANKLCPEVRFREQTSGASCSGTLVGEDLVLTAGHCIVKEADCKGMNFVFGYAIAAPGEKARTEVDAGDVYACSKIVKRELLSYSVTVDHNSPQTVYGPDFALVQLDRKVSGRKPMAINRLGGIKKGDRLFITGHPSGLPFKFTPNGSVVQQVRKEDAYFATNLDAFPGNSGSAVFNADTLLIEGIHVRGPRPIFLTTFDEGCNIYNVLPQNAGTPGSVNKIDYVLDVIPPLPGEAAAERGILLDPETLRNEDVPARKTVVFD